MFLKFCISICILSAVIKIPEILARVEFTNIKCEPLDRSFADFEYCHIKAINRSYKYISLKVNLFQVPVSKIKVNLALMNRFNGYLPFLYNTTVDACKYLENPSSNPIAHYLGNLFLPYSNINHTCPFNDGPILDKLPTSYLNDQSTKVFPMPSGDYAFYTSWMAYGINRANVKVFVVVT